MTRVAFLRKNSTFHVHAGSGGPGPKSVSFINDAELAEHCSIHVPNSGSLSFSLFQPYLERCGALKAPNYREAKRLIREGRFSEEERKHLFSFLAYFPPDQRYRLMVRSDDYAAGVGLSASGPAVVAPTMDHALNQRLILNAVEKQIKEVLASDFCPEVQEFKKRKSLPPVSGILLMPVEGQLFVHNGEPFISPLFTLNLLGLPDSPALYSLGAGIGGANSKQALVKICNEIPFTEFLADAKALDALWQGISLRDGAAKEIVLSKQLRGLLNFLEMMAAGQPLQEMSENLRRFLSLAGRRYMELVVTSAPYPKMSVVQSSTFEYEPFHWPVVREDQVVLRTPYLTGTKQLSTIGIHFADMAPSPEDKEFNSSHKDYLLVLGVKKDEDIMGASAFRMLWKLPDFSNAGAIVIIVNTLQNHTISHLNGLYREISIPVLIIERGKLSDKLRTLRKRTGCHETLKAMVHADEFRPEGVIEVLSC